MGPAPCASNDQLDRPLQIGCELAALYQEFAGELLRYASSVARDEETGRDAVQEVFLRYFIERRFGRIIDHPRGWLYQATRNYLFSRSKTAAAQRESISDTLDSIPDEQPGPERLLGQSELAREVAASLTPRELDCLRLRAEGYAYSEIAGLMNVRSGTVGTMLGRVSRKLRLRSGEFALTDAVRFLFLEDRACSS